MTLQESAIKKLGKLFPLLTSNHDGEVVATAKAIIRTLEANDSSIHDLCASLSPKTVEKIVYRDRIVYKEKIVYRDVPVVQSTGPQWIDITEKEQIVSFADILIKECDLSNSEKDFVTQMRKSAVQRPKMRMSVKQKEWWDRLLDENNVTLEDIA